MLFLPEYLQENDASKEKKTGNSKLESESTYKTKKPQLDIHMAFLRAR